MAMVASWRLRSHQIALCGFRTCALLLIVMDFISYLNDASLILKGYMALEQGPKSLFFKGIYESTKRVCTLLLVIPAESEISHLPIGRPWCAAANSQSLFQPALDPSQ